MARLHIADYQRNLLPPVCMVCGATSADYKEKLFVWNPGSVYPFLLKGPLGWIALIALLITTSITQKQMKIEAPLCHDHFNYWSGRKRFVLISFLVMMSTGIGALVFAYNKDGDDDLQGYVWCGFFVLAFIWLVAAAVIQQSTIRPSQITDDEDEMTLIKVSPDFVEAFEEKFPRPDDYRRRRKQT